MAGCFPDCDCRRIILTVLLNIRGTFVLFKGVNVLLLLIVLVVVVLATHEKWWWCRWWHCWCGLQTESFVWRMALKCFCVDGSSGDGGSGHSFLHCWFEKKCFLSSFLDQRTVVIDPFRCRHAERWTESWTSLLASFENLWGYKGSKCFIAAINGQPPAKLQL